MFFECVCVSCPIFDSWLAGSDIVIIDISPAPLDPVAISNELWELASPLLQPIAFTSLCDCVHACEWAGVLCVCVCVCTHAWIWLNDSNMIEGVCVDYLIKCRLTVTHLFPIHFCVSKTAFYLHSDITTEGNTHTFHTRHAEQKTAHQKV